MYVLVTFLGDDVQGFTICKAEQWESYVDDLEDRGQWPQAYVGMQWDSFEDYRSCFHVEDITADEYETLGGLFGIRNLYDEYGEFPLIEEPEEAW